MLKFIQNEINRKVFFFPVNLWGVVTASRMGTNNNYTAISHAQYIPPLF